MSRPLLVFLHLAKTGGRTLDTVLRNTYGAAYVQAESLAPHRPVGLDDGEFVQPVFGPEEFRRVRRHCPWMQAIGGHPIALWSDIHTVQPVRYVTFLREPLARGASHYQYHVATTPNPLDWPAWCAWPEHHNHQVRYFDHGGDPRHAIAAIQHHGVFVGLLEHFEESLLLMQRLIAPELNVAYVRRNTAARNDLSRELLDDPERRAQLAEMYAGEVPLYDWVRNELWPQYERAYGPGLADDAAALRSRPDRGFHRWRDRAGRAAHRFWIGPWLRSQRRRNDP